MSWPLPEQMSGAELESALFSADVKPPRAPARNLPDFSHIHEELQEHKHVTLQLLWEEYTATHPDGYRYSQFCHHYQQWKRQRDVVMRQQHHPGEKLFVDWCCFSFRSKWRPDQRSGVKAITFPGRRRSVLGFGRKGDRNPGQAAEKRLHKRPTPRMRSGGRMCKRPPNPSTGKGDCM